MNKIYLLNAFSFNLIDWAETNRAKIQVQKLTLEQTKEILEKENVVSYVGHKETASILTGLLGREIPCQRATVTLQHWNQAIIAQYIGPRLPEGTTQLPPGAEIIFLLIMFVSYDRSNTI